MCSPEQPFPVFTTHTIDEIGNRMGQTSLADMDGDGDLDYVVAESPSSKSRLWWFEFQAADTWVRHDIGTANSDVGGSTADLDGNGYPDFWGGTVLVMNRDGKNFTRHEVGTIFSHDSEFCDVNGDGRLDGVANSDKARLFWYEIPEDSTQKWQEHLIIAKEDHEIHGGASPQPCGDIDGDGDTDIVTGQAWYENIDGAGRQWRQHKNIDLGEFHQYGLAVKTWVGDLDEDGDVDVIQAEADNPDSRVAWFENDGAGAFTRHIIKARGDKQDFHSLVVADFDNDGDLDVFSGGGPLSTPPQRCYIWENENLTWIEHDLGEVVSHEAVGGDVDGDGDIDIVTKPWKVGMRHVYFENQLN